MKAIRKVAVLGSGVMGSGIAAHLANVGIKTLLLDIVPTSLTKEEEAQGLTLADEQVRNRFATTALQKLTKQKPAPLMKQDNIHFITPGNFDDHFDLLKEVDWIIEVVVERLDVKKRVFEHIDRVRKKGTFVSSNTSGISIEKMAEGRSDDFKAHFLGTHFFNPPRYLKLLELIPTKDTKQEVLTYMKQFAENVLGKGVVVAKDTPNFIGNRIGTYGLLATVKEMEKSELTFSEVDELTGPLIGRPKSATFRTLDVVGLDTFIHVANNVKDQVEGEERALFTVPDYMNKMVDKGYLGAKTKKGFFVKEGKEIFQLNPSTLEYEERNKVDASVLQPLKMLPTKQKIKTLAYSTGREGQFIWNVLKATLLYAAEKTEEIADNILAIDQAMKWGFGWNYGPFEIWDIIGLASSVEKMKKEGTSIPNWIEEMLEKGYTQFYQEESGTPSYYDQGAYKLIETNEKEISLASIKKSVGVLQKNNGASLIDIGDGVALLEFHSKNNAIGLDITSMIQSSLDEVEKNYRGLVIGNQAKNFCVGANLALLLMEAEDDNFFELELVVRQFQQAMMRIKYAEVPVVAAPFQMALGGGCEVCLPATKIQATSETYMGLVEVGVGLIPGGGGNKELYMRELERMPKGVAVPLENITQKAFETIAMAKVSTSADQARDLGYLSVTDSISYNPDHVIYDAKQEVLYLAEQGFKPRIEQAVPVAGAAGYGKLLLGVETMLQSGFISEHDAKIARKLAYVLSGGKVAAGTKVSEQYLLDLEREAFLSLIGERKTQERMRHMLTKGKPLRN